MPTIVSLDRAQTNFSTNREKLDFAEGIALLDPNENPFTLISMKMGRGSSGNIKHSWLEDELQPETDTTNLTSAVTTAGVSISVDNIARFAIGDLVKRNASGEIVLVTAISTSLNEGSIIGTRDYGQGDSTPGYTARADTIADGDYLTIIGNAFEQGHVLPVRKSTVEVERYNFCQDLRTPFGISEVAAAAAVHGEADWPFQMRKKGIEHSRKLEYMNIWGVPVQGDKGLYASATGNTKPQAAAGIDYWIRTHASSSRKVTQADITQAEFLSFLEAAFEFGSAEKIMYCPPVLRSALDFWGISKLQTFSEKTLFGMNVARWVSSHGTIIFVSHKMLKDPGTADGANAYLLDMKNIRWITYSNIGSTRLRTLDPYKATGATTKQAEFQTISCIEMKLPETHAYLTGLKTYSA